MRIRHIATFSAAPLLLTTLTTPRHSPAIQTPGSGNGAPPDRYQSRHCKKCDKEYARTSDEWKESGGLCSACDAHPSGVVSATRRSAQAEGPRKPDMMTDDERDRFGFSRRDQSQYNAFQDIAQMIRDHRALSPEQRMAKWKAWVEMDIAEKGKADIPRFFVSHYQVALRKAEDGKYEAFLTDFKAWQPKDEAQYPDLSKGRRNKPLARFDTLEEASAWIARTAEEQRMSDKDNTCPGCENYIEDDEVGQQGIVVEDGQRWHQACLDQDRAINERLDEEAARYDPQEELPSDREAKSLWQMPRFAASGNKPYIPDPRAGSGAISDGFRVCMKCGGSVFSESEFRGNGLMCGKCRNRQPNDPWGDYLRSQAASEGDSHGVFVWKEDGRYPAKDAVRVFRSKALAQRFADRNQDKNYVVRTIWNPKAHGETRTAQSGGKMVFDDQGMYPQHDCKACGKPLNADGGHPAELYAGTYTGLCYECEKKGAYEEKELPSGAKMMSHPPHCPSWRRDRERFYWFPDCANQRCDKGREMVSRSLSLGGSYPVQCPACMRRHSTSPATVAEDERLLLERRALGDRLSEEAKGDVEAITRLLVAGDKPQAQAMFDEVAKRRKLKDYEAMMLAEVVNKRAMEAKGEDKPRRRRAMSLWETKKAQDESCPCKVCGETTRMTGTRLCDRCWEIASAMETGHMANNHQYNLASLELKKKVRDACCIDAPWLDGPRPAGERVAQVIPADGIADGGTPYTDEEMDLMEGKVAPVTEDKPRKWSVRVSFDDGDVVETWINGTRDEIRRYYLSNDFVLRDEKTTHRPTSVEFLEDLGDVPWLYWGSAAWPDSARQPEPKTPWPKSPWDR